LAISARKPDPPSSTTIDRLLDLIQDHPEGLTIKQLANLLNRPISMVQICLKTPVVSQSVTFRPQNNGQQLAKVYIARPDQAVSARQLHLVANHNCSDTTPTILREMAGLTKIQLAAQLGLSIKTINNWEQRRSQPKLTPAQLKQMICVYQCTLDQLIAAFEDR
jgi:DNA-binding transcriptional regulator YiaG